MDLTAVYVVATLAVLATLLYVSRVVLRKRWGRCVNGQSMRGKVVLVTGANCGIGFETAKELVARDAFVIMACRDLDKASQAADFIRRKFPEAQMRAMELDLGSFESVRNFSRQVIKDYPTIDVLINNAGVAVPILDGMKTKEGFEINFGINHLGHFLLTNLLLDSLKRSPGSRVVIVSSSLMKDGYVDFEDLNLTALAERIKNGSVSKFKDSAYANSKLMNAYFGTALASMLGNSDPEIFIVCPGFTYSNLFRYAFRWYFYFFVPLFYFVMRSTNQGAQTSIYCATEPSLKGMSGCFFKNCKPSEFPAALDKTVEQRLWEVSEQLTRTKRT